MREVAVEVFFSVFSQGRTLSVTEVETQLLVSFLCVAEGALGRLKSDDITAFFLVSWSGYWSDIVSC